MPCPRSVRLLQTRILKLFGCGPRNLMSGWFNTTERRVSYFPCWTELAICGAVTYPHGSRRKHLGIGESEPVCLRQGSLNGRGILTIFRFWFMRWNSFNAEFFTRTTSAHWPLPNRASAHWWNFVTVIQSRWRKCDGEPSQSTAGVMGAHTKKSIWIRIMTA